MELSSCAVFNGLPFRMSKSTSNEFGGILLRSFIDVGRKRFESGRGSYVLENAGETFNIVSMLLTAGGFPQKIVHLERLSSAIYPTTYGCKGYRSRFRIYTPPNRSLAGRVEQDVLGVAGRNLSQARVICKVAMADSLSVLDRGILHDLAMGLVTLSGALAGLKFWDELAKREVFDKKVSRKLVHISIGLLFMLFWPLFSNGYVARYIAAFSPAVNGLRVLAIGFGIIEDDAVVKAMTREGDRKELLKGPFYYGMTISLATLCFWRTSPLAPIIIANMCAGDGFADLIGRRLGSAKLPHNRNKSYAGSFSMLILGFLFSIGYQYYLSSFGYYEMTLNLVLHTFIVSLVATVVESLPVSTLLDDNLTVPFTSFLVGSFLI